MSSPREAPPGRPSLSGQLTAVPAGPLALWLCSVQLWASQTCLWLVPLLPLPSDCQLLRPGDRVVLFPQLSSWPGPWQTLNKSSQDE